MRRRTEVAARASRERTKAWRLEASEEAERIRGRPGERVIEASMLAAAADRAKLAIFRGGKGIPSGSNGMAIVAASAALTAVSVSVAFLVRCRVARSGGASPRPARAPRWWLLRTSAR